MPRTRETEVDIQDGAGTSMEITQKEVTGSAGLLYNQVKILDGREAR